MEIKMVDAISRPFATGMRALCDSKDLEKMVAHRVGWIFKKVLSEVTEWEKFVVAKREESEATLGPDATEPQKQVAQMALNKLLNEEVDKRTIVVKCAKIQYGAIPKGLLNGEQLNTLEPIFEGAPNFEQEAEEVK